MFKRRRGTAATRDFYNRVGWRRQNGTLVDTLLFGWADGPIHQALDSQRKERLLQVAGRPDLRLAELGCGGTPAIFLAERCTKFIAVDFSSTGLSEAAAALRGTNVAFETVEADITDLPFEDDAFDVVYSAHAIYHIDTVDGQAAALREAMRVVRPLACEAAFALSADAAGMDERTVREVGRCKDHRACRAKCSVRSPRF